jgi:hypothetical protein
MSLTCQYFAIPTYQDVQTVWLSMSAEGRQAILSIANNTCADISACLDLAGLEFAQLFGVESTHRECLECLAAKLNAIPYKEWTQSYNKLITCANVGVQQVFLKRLGELMLLIQNIDSNPLQEEEKQLLLELNNSSNYVKRLDALCIPIIVFVLILLILVIYNQNYKIKVGLAIIVFLAALFYALWLGIWI